MVEQERLEHGPQSYVFAEYPLPQPAPGQKLWFSPTLDAFTSTDPFTAHIKGGLLCDEVRGLIVCLIECV